MSEPTVKYSLFNFTLRTKCVFVDFPILHDEINVLLCIHQQANILGWVAIDDNESALTNHELANNQNGIDADSRMNGLWISRFVGNRIGVEDRKRQLTLSRLAIIPMTSYSYFVRLVEESISRSFNLPIGTI